ncbi:methyltransferase domain-containing protein [Candidatus Woesearchaeota archaeon]|nr:methyltransferase domain-containing protein [Candidatus Woesearchaeota archaeon]
MICPVITKVSADRIIGSGNVGVSLDLGITVSKINVSGNIAHIRDQKIPISDLKNLKEKMCYAVEDNKVKQIAFFSDETNLYYKLLPTKDWPTITLSSTPMHRFTFISPKEDTELKIREILPAKGRVLDTCCGLGYTAIMSAEHADEVHTFERDENVLRIASYNPHSQELFSSKKIHLHRESISSAIARLSDSYFDCIIHDPPTFKYAPELYSSEFHRELFRVLKKGGVLYHYCPSPQRTKGRTMYPRLIRQLRNSGFRNAEFHESSSGIRAVK